MGEWTDCSLFGAAPVDMKAPRIDGDAGIGLGLRSMVILVRDSVSAVTRGVEVLVSPHFTAELDRLLNTISNPPLTGVTEQEGGCDADDTERFAVTGVSPSSAAAEKHAAAVATLVAPQTPVSSVENSDMCLAHLSVHGHSIMPESVDRCG